MYRRCALGIAIGLLGLFGAGAASAQTPAVTAFENVSVIPMDREQVLTRQTVLVQGDRIIKMGPAGRVRVPATATRIDGTGKYLLPGLADMHAHLGGEAPEEVASQFLAAGVTTVRDMLATRGTLALKERIAHGEVVGPRIYSAAEMTGSCNIQQVTKCVAEMKAAGYDFIKFYGWISFGGQPPAPDSVARLANEWQAFDSVAAAAHRVGIGISGHMDRVGIERALRARVASAEHAYGYMEYATGLPPVGAIIFGSGGARYARDIEHLLDSAHQFDVAKMSEIAVATRRAGTWVVPTLANRITTEELIRGKTAATRQLIQFHLQVVKALHDAGAGLLMGTDAPHALAQTLAGPADEYLPGPTVRQELELLVKAGLTPYQALETGTRNAAVFLGTLAQAGTVETGKNADLVLLTKNPLEDIGRVAEVAGVMVRGRWLSRAELDHQEP